jgi:NADPH:quinone reductase-like Zn-dependent oxidoreductase
MPETMRAVVVREHGGPERLREESVPIPEPGASEVRVAVRAVALNHMDLWVRNGIPGVSFPLPLIPGCDVAGVVDAVGHDVRHITPGERVVVAPGYSCGHCRACLAGEHNLCAEFGIFGESRNGGCAEFIVVPAVNVFPIPGEMSFESIAAVPLVFLTAWHMLVARAHVKPTDTVLVLAAGSGVGSAAVQIAKLHGARVIATASSDAKLQHARAIGADDVVNYTNEDFGQAVRRITNKRGVDIVFEHVGSATWAASLRSLAKGGRLVTCGATSGHEVETNLRLVFFKSLSILGSTMGSLAEVGTVLDLVGRGKLRPVVDSVLPLERVADAHKKLEEREQFGKIVLTI